MNFQRINSLKRRLHYSPPIGRRTKDVGLPTHACPSIPWFLGFPWLILSKEFPCLFLYFLCLFQGFCGFSCERKSLVNLRFLMTKECKDRDVPSHPYLLYRILSALLCMCSLDLGSEGNMEAGALCAIGCVAPSLARLALATRIACWLA